MTLPPDLTVKPATRPGLWQRTPPAIFPPVLGLMGLALGWRRAVGGFGIPAGLADLLAGAVALLFLFVFVAYAAKMMRRPGVAIADLKILPGRAGLAAAVLAGLMFSVLLGPVAPGAARVVFWIALALQGALIGAILFVFATGPAEQRRVTPVWHLSFTGVIVTALAAQPLGYAGLGSALFWVALAAASGIWLISLQQLSRADVPAPLRPLMAIHLAPAALMGTVAIGFDAQGIAGMLGILSVLILAAALVRLRWLLAAGFSPLWGALTFPLAATAGFWIALGGVWLIPGGILLAAASIIVPAIATKVLQLWAKGQLAAKTGAVAA